MKLSLKPLARTGVGALALFTVLGGSALACSSSEKSEKNATPTTPAEAGSELDAGATEDAATPAITETKVVGAVDGKATRFGEATANTSPFELAFGEVREAGKTTNILLSDTEGACATIRGTAKKARRSLILSLAAGRDAKKTTLPVTAPGAFTLADVVWGDEPRATLSVFTGSAICPADDDPIATITTGSVTITAADPATEHYEGTIDVTLPDGSALRGPFVTSKCAGTTCL